ncbi:hypothetical protein FisN_31Hu015 [Fistulifera solaris]|uniref:Ubiquitin-like domain-containing protein n=1 Tax=Fistulifera solaris TaxID=1519565 RepID=A0A1Z5JWK9_FISSO|nr:hypothetical protein FisN_31Hu015 [Fistulifera solaris]|eukprot:GAX18232.1 hypothetical protein FisN_31Hu015 [Fistulifera solaris]
MSGITVVIFDLLTRKATRFRFQPQTTFRNIMKVYEEKFGVPVAQQRLYFNNNPLEENTAIGNSAVQNGNVIDLDRLFFAEFCLSSRASPFSSKVLLYMRQIPDRFVPIIVESAASIHTLMKRFEAHFHDSPIERQSLTFYGIPLEKHRTVNDYHLKNNSIIDVALDNEELAPSLQNPPPLNNAPLLTVHVRSISGKTLTLCVRRSSKISKMKRIIYEKTGILPNDQRLRYFGESFNKSNTFGSMLPDETQQSDEIHFDLMVALPYRHNRGDVPIGSFDEPAMVAELKLRAARIRKSIHKVKKLRGELRDFTKIEYWMNKKEKYATDIFKTVAEFCLCERVERRNFDDEDFFHAALKAHHKVMRLALDLKSSVDIATVDKLDAALKKLFIMYIQ